jgi:hypothetical protein
MGAMVAAFAVLAGGFATGSTPVAGERSAASVGAPGEYAPDTRMDAAVWSARQDAYLTAATAGPLNPTDPESVIAFAERARREPGFDAGLEAATAATFDDILNDGFSDDFTLASFLTLLLNHEDQLDPSLAQALKDKLLSWKYWWTEEPLDEQPGANYYWTENHQILFAAEEYLAGQAFPDDVFPSSGMTGREHQANAIGNIQRWIELRSRYGFSEFLSVPYTAYTFQGVLLLAELADDPELADQASKVLDLMLVEISSHLQDFAMGSAKGRTYTGNLFDLRGGATPAIASLVFGSGAPPTGTGPAVALAVADRYRPPEVAVRIASSQEEAVVRQNQSLPLDPTAPVTPNPVAPDQLTFDGDYGLQIWWSLGAQLAWQMAPQSVDAIEAYGLWDTPNFQAAGAGVLESIVAGKSDDELRALAQSLGIWLNPGLLSQVDTYTWRSPDAMLSTAQDWRAGQRTESALISQATLDGAASVFTNLPKGDPNDGGYWSGDGSAPRAAQHDRTAISVYAPQYEAGGTGGFNGYQPFTHAFFPQDRFDEVVQVDGWTFARQADGYVALWSWRPTEWVPFDASVDHPAGVTSPWELRAPGGPDNVWITQVGRSSDFDGAADPFQAFVDAVTADAPVVRPLAGATPCAPSTPATLGSCAHGPADGFLVSYDDTTGTELSFGWSPKAADRLPALRVDGTVTELHDPDARWSSPWSSAGRDGRYRVEIEGQVLEIELPVPQPVPTTPTTTTTTAPPATVADPPGATPIPGSANYTG